MAIKQLIASDMDGTFLDENRSYDKKKLAEILVKFDEKDVVFCAASGRQLLALETLFADFTDKIAFVAENGALVKYHDQILYHNVLGKEKAREIVKTVRSHPEMKNDVILFSGLNGAYVLDSAPDEFFDFAGLYYKDLQRISTIDDINDDILKVCVEFPPEKVRECEAWINEKVSGIHATTTGFRSIDIMNAGITKATGLSNLLEHLNLTSSNLTAFGDQMNDYEMLKLAGKSIAVENAVAQIKAIADVIIPEHTTGSVLKEMSKLS